VHCAECGKPFHVENGSEVIQVARPVPSPFGPRPRAWRKFPRWLLGKLPRWLGIVGGCGGLLFLMILLSVAFYLARESSRKAEMDAATPAKIDPLGRWGQLHGLPPTATLFGAIELGPSKALTLDDDETQSLLRLLVPKETASRITSQNLGRIRINGIGLACYESKAENTWAILQLNGTALDGRKRIVDYVQRDTKGEMPFDGANKGQSKGESVYLSSPKFPLAVKLVDDRHAYLATYLNRQGQPRQLLGILDKVPSSVNVLSGYNPPWVKAALNAVPSDACGFFLGEIPASWHDFLTDALCIWLRVRPRSFVCHLKKESQGVTLFLTLNVDLAKEDVILRDDLERWRGQALDALRRKHPALEREPAAMALLLQILHRMRWHADGGSVRTQLHLRGSDWKVLVEAVTRVSQVNGEEWKQR
jgi:hypothetical protein